MTELNEDNENLEELLSNLPNVKESLNRVYDSFIDENEPNFFRGIANYVDFVNNSRELEWLMTPYIKEKDELLNSIAELEEQVSKELNENVIKIKISIEEGSLEADSKIEDLIENFDRRLAETVYSSQTQLERDYDIAVSFVRSLFLEGFEGIVAEFVTCYENSGDRKTIQNVSLAPSYQKYIYEMDKYKSQQNTSFWGCWDHLNVVFLALNKREETLK